MKDADYFIEKAEQCFQLAEFARGHALSLEIAKGIDALGDEFVNKAVEIDTARQRSETARARIREGDWYLVMGERRAKVSISASLSTQAKLQE